jgi:hypothetical protein
LARLTPVGIRAPQTTDTMRDELQRVTVERG